ncbi:MAG: hypothetical protein K0R67_2142 [Paenibacillus sp.]|jgi:4'-phosphopantetheinyl transferase|nr:hypothetical protein [Paenibacillus sp.]
MTEAGDREMVEIQAVYQSEPISSSDYHFCLNSLPEEKRSRILAFRRVEDAQRTLLGELLIRTWMSSKLGIAPTALQFTIDSYGKPHLSSSGGLRYNISHSGEWVVGALHEASVGIDVEHVRPIDMGIAERFFAPEECEDLFRQPEAEQLGYFYDLWTGKESYIKAEGRGLSIPLKQFAIRKEGGAFRMQGDAASDGNWYFRQYSIDSAYRLCVCARTEDFPEKPNLTTAEDIVALYRRLLEGACNSR